jgi:cytochrome P450
MLAMHKDVQQKVIDEIDSFNLEENFTISNEVTKDLKYIDMVLKEVMRLFPVAPIMMRETTEEIDLDGHTIPEGSMIALITYFMHRNAKYWGDDADKFRPERFESQNVENVHPFAYVPFSSGKRICYGYKYAMYFMKIFIVTFFKSYEVDTSLRFNDIDVQLTPTLNIIQGYKISVRERVRTKKSV